MPLRIAMVGSGPRAKAHIEAMRASRLAEPVAFWDRTSAVAAALAQENGIFEQFEDVATMVAVSKPDVVDIVTHPSARYELMRSAVDAGAKVILVEKPLALTPDELERVESLGRSCLIVVNTQYRWMSHWVRFWELLRAYRLGEIHLIRASTGVDILEQGPHIVSLALSAARAAGLPAPSWALAGGGGSTPWSGLSVPAELIAVSDLGQARLEVLAGAAAPSVPGEQVIFYQQQVEVIGSTGRLWVSLNQGWQLSSGGHFESGPTRWPADDYQSQADLFRTLAAALTEPDLQATFPTRTQVAAEEARLIFAWIASAQGHGRIDLHDPHAT